MHRPRTERSPGVRHNGGLESDGVGGRDLVRDGHGGGAEVYGRKKEKRGRRGWSSPEEERCDRDNLIGKLSSYREAQNLLSDVNRPS